MPGPSEAPQAFLIARACDARGDQARAYALCGDVLAEWPDYPPALHLMGLLHWRMGQDEAAADLIGRAVAADPDNAFFQTDFALPLRGLGRHEEALACLDAALALRPDYDIALNNRGLVLRALRRLPEALAAFRAVVARCPDNVAALVNGALVMEDLGLGNEALASYEQALTVQPGLVQALHGRAAILFSAGRFAEAALAFERLLEASPGHPHARRFLHHARLHECDWTDTAAMEATPISEQGEVPFILVTLSSSAAEQLASARAFVGATLPAALPPMWTGQAYGHRRIRLAYLSAGFYDHIVSIVLSGLFERHDRERFEITAVSLAPPVHDAMRARLEAAFDAFIDADGLSDAEIAALLHQRETDIVVDLQGFSMGGRPGILQHRPAPVQVNFLGYAGTMGADGYDYILADGTVIPPGHEGFYSEKIARLPNSYLVDTSGRAPAPRTPSRGEAGLPEEGFVFCCFSNTLKIMPGVFEVWMRLLAQTPGSVLWLARISDGACANLRQAAEAGGVDPARLVFAGHVQDIGEHLARHRLADLFLDTLPYNAHAMGADALGAGAPVLTCLGTTFPGRVGASLLKAAGLPELITNSQAEYEAKALEIATTPGMAADLKARLAHNRAHAALFDIDRYARDVEAALVAMHERAGRGLPPETFGPV